MYSGLVPASLQSLRTSLALAILALGLASVSADVVTTTDGKSYEGAVTSQEGGKVVIETTFDGTKEFARADVKSVDLTVSPLRRQLAFRLEQAKDVPSLTALVDWAKSKGFKPELLDVWKKVLAVDPNHVKAHKALGHVLVGKVWMTPEEKASADAAAVEATARAKGLVPYEGRWVTPAEKEALEKGLLKDGDDWVTEEEFHRRRGETKVDGKWARLGEAEARARAATLSKELGLTLKVEWAPHVDLIHELEAPDAKMVLDATEKVAAGFHRLMRPGPGDRLDGVRLGLHCFLKAPTYARFCEAFAKEIDVASIPGLESWARQAGRVTGFMWPKPGPVIGGYLFPYKPPELASFASHKGALALLARYRLDYKHPAPGWLAEGLAYVLELEANGRTDSYAVLRAGVAGGGDPGPWMEFGKWKDALKAAVAATQDTPAPRLMAFSDDQFQLPDLVKSWSLVTLLIRLDREKFKALVDGLKTPDTTADQALKAAYNLDARAFEARWRAWVEGGFQGP